MSTLGPWEPTSEAVKRYADYMRSRKGSGHSSRVMPPWDENAYFQLPKFTQVQLVGGAAPVQIVAADPNRVVLIITVQPRTTVTVTNWVQLANSSIGAQNNPINYTQSTSPFILMQSAHGPLPAIEWWGMSPGDTQNVGVCEVILSRWPSR